MFFIRNIKKSRKALTHALIAVATAMPISLIDPIKSSDLVFGGVVSLGAIGIITKIKLRILKN